MNKITLTAKRAQDSTSMTMMALYSPPIPLFFITVRTLLVCRMSRTTIMSVRRTLSETKIEQYGSMAHSLLISCADW